MCYQGSWTEKEGQPSEEEACRVIPKDWVGGKKALRTYEDSVKRIEKAHKDGYTDLMMPLDELFMLITIPTCCGGQCAANQIEQSKEEKE
jgi:hypothetical protein